MRPVRRERDFFVSHCAGIRSSARGIFQKETHNIVRPTLLLFLLCALSFVAAPAQDEQIGRRPPAADQQAVPVFKANVVGRTTEAVNWHHASGTTKVNLQGTQLMPDAKGEARVKSEAGRIRIETTIRDLGDPQQFGREYLTYVLFAITPEGRTQNLGEIIRNDKGKASTQTFTTTLQTFGLIITAEPYFAVPQPSDLVVMENVIRKDTVGATVPINVHYELISRGGYIPPQSTFAPLIIDQKLPFDLYEARNAVHIALANGADKYAAPSLSARRRSAHAGRAICGPQARPIEAGHHDRPLGRAAGRRRARHRRAPRSRGAARQ